MRHSPGGIPLISDLLVHRLPFPKPAVVCCEVEQGAVLLSTDDETYYGLNQVGARIWSLLPPAHSTLQGLCQALAQSYPDVSPETLEEDVRALLDDLLRNGLVLEGGAS